MFNRLSPFGRVAFDSRDYQRTTYTSSRRTLNLDKLKSSGVFRITYAADGKGGYVANEDPKSFAVVTAINEVAPGNWSPRSWPNKPSAYQEAMRLMAGRWLDDGKYSQIVDSAVAMGLGPKDVYTDA